MGGGAFDLLKSGCDWPESGKQPKAGIAQVRKILSILSLPPRNGSPVGLNCAVSLI